MLPSPWISNTAFPDASSLKRLHRHPRFAGKDDESLAIAIWKYTVDPQVGFYHFGSPCDLDLHRPHVRLDYVKDPLKLIHSYGYMLCGTVAALFVNLCQAGGIPARIIGVTGHTICEAYFDEMWHLFDCDMCGYYRLREEGHAIASMWDLLKDPTLITDPVEKIEPYGLPDRSPEAIARICWEPGVGSILPDFNQEFHSMDFVLRPGETLTRYATSKGDRWSFPPTYVKTIKDNPDHKEPGPRERFAPHRTFLNGCFEYKPNLTNKSNDLKYGAWKLSNLQSGQHGMQVTEATDKNEGEVEFLIHSPWVITGHNDDLTDPGKSSNGAIVKLDIHIPDKAGSVALRLSLNGRDWEEVGCWNSSQVVAVDLTPQLNRRHRGLLSLQLKNAAVVRNLETNIWFQLGHNSYPYLSEENNTFCYHALSDLNNDGGQNCEATLSEPWEATLDGNDDALASPIVDSQNLKHGTEIGQRLLPIDPKKPWQATFKVSPNVLTEQPIRHVNLWAAISSFKGDPETPPADYDPQTFKATIEAAESPQGPWQPVVTEPVQLHKEGWHFALSGPFTPSSKNLGAVYMRLTSTYPGSEIRATVTCAVPENAIHHSELPPLEITHHWVEAGVNKEHTECVRNSLQETEYSVLIEKGKAKDISVVMRIAST